MKLREKHVVIGAVSVALAMLLFPPWQATVRNNVTINLGYHFVGAAPEIGAIDVVRLLIQLGIIGIVAFVVLKLIERQPLSKISASGSEAMAYPRSDTIEPAMYDPLRDHLSAQRASSIVLDFAEVEQIIGRPLPRSARTHREWWANEKNPSTSHVQCRAWQAAGYEALPNLSEEVVTFKRTDDR